MSENLRKVIGVGLLAATAMILAAGLMPLKSDGTGTYSSREIPEISITMIQHLDPGSLPNAGTPEMLTEIPGVGYTTAESMIRERGENGIFHYPEDLSAVSGIGEKRLEQIRLFLSPGCGESEE